MIDKALYSLGFTEIEIKLYKELIASGQSKAANLSKILNINRPTVYASLDSLIQKGLVSKIKKGAVTIFLAQDPETLLSYLDREEAEIKKDFENKRDELAESLVELKSIQYSSADRAQVKLFEGEKGMREAYEDTLTAKDIILAYANVQTMHEGLPKFFPEYYKRRAGADLHIRAILPKNKLSLERAKLDREEMRTSRFLPEDDTFSPEINIYNNKVLIASWKEQMALIIESRELAEFHRVMFERVWETLERTQS